MKPIAEKNRIFLPLLVECRPPNLNSETYHLVCTLWPGKEIILRTQDSRECLALKQAYERCITNAKAKLFNYGEFITKYRKEREKEIKEELD